MYRKICASRETFKQYGVVECWSFETEVIMKSFPRHVERIIEPQPVVEGAGVKLKRSIGTQTLGLPRSVPAAGPL